MCGNDSHSAHDSRAARGWGRGTGVSHVCVSNGWRSASPQGDEIRQDVGKLAHVQVLKGNCSQTVVMTNEIVAEITVSK